jgi:hypothetical protein
MNDVRYWHLADMLMAFGDVRFRRQSGHGQDFLPCPLMTLTQPSFRSEMWYPLSSPTWCSARGTEDGGNSWR